MQKSLFIRILCVFISSLIFSVLLFVIGYINEPSPVPPEPGVVDMTPPVLSTFLVIQLYAIPIFLILGIPVSYLIDSICKLINLKTNILIYLFKLLLYCIAATIIYKTLFNDFFLSFLPVLTYFHVLLFLEKFLTRKSLQ
ncbi:hypothetical protein [Heyndrickxia camelliae]|uniref:Uncharacterized protein n=1 Tax=Heyndrickxia camelliae TaxID=1707093 RepID=A0A2N3LQG3_9BACI|nr:hypothetical protein [Heyndrickxia camelliae]PKR86807.1 hypothetical protein CWO92_01735 [Heyndrickxia camelliae]